MPENCLSAYLSNGSLKQSNLIKVVRMAFTSKLSDPNILRNNEPMLWTYPMVQCFKHGGSYLYGLDIAQRGQYNDWLLSLLKPTNWNFVASCMQFWTALVRVAWVFVPRLVSNVRMTCTARSACTALSSQCRKGPSPCMPCVFRCVPSAIHVQRHMN